MNICLSHWKTIQMMDSFGEKFDNEVLTWKDLSEKSDALFVNPNLVIIYITQVAIALYTCMHAFVGVI